MLYSRWVPKWKIAVAKYGCYWFAKAPVPAVIKDWPGRPEKVTHEISAGGPGKIRYYAFSKKEDLESFLSRVHGSTEIENPHD